MAPDLHRTTLALTVDQYEWLRSKAFGERVSIAVLIRRLIEESRRREDPQERLRL